MSAFDNLATIIKRDYIDSGKYAVGTKLPTIRELAAFYGFSMPTVGKAVDLLMKQGWVNKCQGSGVYIETLSGANRELRIGFVASSLDVSLAHGCLRGVNYVVKRNSGILEVVDSSNSIDEEYKQVSRMYERGIDGIVVYCLDGMFKGKKKDYLETEFRDIPIVVVDLYRPVMNRPHVIFDNFSLGREMTQYLIREGRNKIAFLKFNGCHSALDQRLLGYKRALSDAEIDEQVIVYDPRSETVDEDLFELLSEVFAGTNIPDAIELPCDSVFKQVYPMLEKIGVSVPADVLLTGCDNLTYLHNGHVWPTSTPDFERMGERAAELLLECIKTGIQKDTEIVLPCPIYVPKNFSKINEMRSGRPEIKRRSESLQSQLR